MEALAHQRLLLPSIFCVWEDDPTVKQTLSWGSSGLDSLPMATSTWCVTLLGGYHWTDG